MDKFIFIFPLLLVQLAFVQSDDNDLFVYKKIFDDGILARASDYVDSSEFWDTQCAEDIRYWKRSPTSLWALKMVDASGKFPAGMLSGNINSVGNFAECLSINHNDSKTHILGKYCPTNLILTHMALHIEKAIIGFLYPGQDIVGPVQNLTANFGKINFFLGTCIPHSCNGTHIENFITGIFKILNDNVTKEVVTVEDKYCVTSQDGVEWTGLIIFGVVVFSIFGGLLIISTIYDLLVKFQLIKKHNLDDILKAFSVYTNTEKLTKINKSFSSLRCIHGIRVLSLGWVMLGHRYSTAATNFLDNQLDINDWFAQWHAGYILGASVAVDTFFLLSGLLLAYVFLGQHQNVKRFNPGLFYLHRFLRLWPAMAALVLFQLTIYKFLGSGPRWQSFADFDTTVCEGKWWTTLLYIQNYFDAVQPCVGHLWYLAIDTQLYVLSPILLVPLLINRKIGIINMIFWFAVFQIATITMVFLYKWGAQLVADETYYTLYYAATYARAPVWLLGFLGGYLIYITKGREVRMNKYFNIFLWLVCLVVMHAIVLSSVRLGSTRRTVLEDNAFNAFARTAWGLCIFWIIFSCVNGYGGPINFILSLRGWEILARLSYSGYLMHLMVQNWFTGSIKSAYHFSQFNLVYTYFGDLIVSFMVAYVWVITFEAPFLAIEKAIFHKKKENTPIIPVQHTGRLPLDKEKI